MNAHHGTPRNARQTLPKGQVDKHRWTTAYVNVQALKESCVRRLFDSVEKPALERLIQAWLGYHGERMISGEQEIRDATYQVHRSVSLAGSEPYIGMSPRQVRESIQRSQVMKHASFLGPGLGHGPHKSQRCLLCDPAMAPTRVSGACCAIHQGLRKLASLVCVVDKNSNTVITVTERGAAHQS